MSCLFRELNSVSVPLTSHSTNDYETLFHTLSFVTINRSNDQPIYRLNTRGSFLVRSLYNYLIKNDDTNASISFRQICKVTAPPKVAFFAWEASDGCIFTIDKLMRRWRMLVNECFLCKREGESCNHIFLWCPLVYKFWTMTYGLLGSVG